MITTPSPPVFRFAPSPNGALHLGHAYSALLNDQMAKAQSGRFLLRIEDIDQRRCTPALERAMLGDLQWLGLSWEEPVRRQSDHFDNYAAALDQLEKAGLVYRSTLTRGDIRRFVEVEKAQGKTWPRDPDGAPLFPGRDYAATDVGDEAYAVRLDMKAAIKKAGPLSWVELRPSGAERQIIAHPERWGDVVLARRDAPTSYHMAVVVDDALQNISHVVRGKDLYEATAVHVLLQKLLGLPQPIYCHHDLILDDDGQKLSKSRGDTALSALRAEGVTPKDVRKRVGLEP